MAKRLIVSAERNAGKTTSALTMAKMLGEKAGGFITLSNDNKKTLFIKSLETGEERVLMSDDPALGPKLGDRYFYSEETFGWAEDAIANSDKSVILIDEVGRLELSGKGYADAVRKVLSTDKDVILFVRWLFVDEVMDRFDMWDADLVGAGLESFAWMEKNYGKD